jgi:DHA1 family multidrug resistance protein-like MFS transporter
VTDSRSADDRPPGTGPNPRDPDHGRSDWRTILAAFWITQLVEAAGVSQIFAFLPAYLAELGVGLDDRLAFVGVFSSLIFLVGAPLVPLWGVWADRYSRRAVIARSAVVEAVVFTGVALSAEPWQVGASLLFVGLQLGNTGVMLAAIRDVVPRRRLGAAVGLFGAATPIGFAVGPILGGVLVDGVGVSLTAVFLVSAAASLATAVLVMLTREVRPEVILEGGVVALALASVRGVLADGAVRRIFAVFFVSFLAVQMTRPYIPILVEGIVGLGPGLAAAIGLVTGAAALVGALAAPLGGVAGDRVGFRPVLLVGLTGASVALALTPLAPVVILLAVAALAFTAFSGVVGPMVFALLATEVPPERRSSTLNLVYLPLYAAGIVGPATGAVVATIGSAASPFFVGALILGMAAAVMARAIRRRQRAAAL